MAESGELTVEELNAAKEFAGAPVYHMTKEEQEAAVQQAEKYWGDQVRTVVQPVNVSILDSFLEGVGEEDGERLEPPGDYKGGQLPVMPRTIGLPTYAAIPEKQKSLFPEKRRRPMIRLYCFPGSADNFMLWIEFATSAPEWCEVAVYEPRAHGFRRDEPWDTTLEERAADAFKVMRPAFETHARGGVSEGAPFAFLAHGVGTQILALVAHRLKREMNLEPVAVFANDGPSSHVSTISPKGFALMCKDPYKFYQIFQPETIRQVDRLGKTSKEGIALLQKWYRDLRMFEEHTYRAIARGEPFHKFNCDVYVIVAKKTQDFMTEAKDFLPEAKKKELTIKESMILSGPNTIALWNREGFKKWAEWTTEDFIYMEADVDHMAAKNAKEVQKIVFKELAGFCGMDYTG